MDCNGATPGFDPGYYVGTFLVSSGLLPQAWKASCAAYTSDEPYFIVEEDVEEEGRVFIAFEGSLDWFDVFKADGMFGQCEIESENHGDLFGFMEDEALVHGGILKRFMDMWENSGIQSQILKAGEQNKTIVFTGHSLAGAIASLATLSVLEKYGRTVSVFCVTFGCPLIGDDKFGQVIRRKGWFSKFCHVLSVHDIVSRVLLAPLQLIHGPMEVLLPYWFRRMTEQNNDKTNSFMAGIPLSNQQIADFYSIVLHHISALVTYSNPVSMTAPESMIRESIKSVFNLSPYRPFGYYLFCSRSGAVCVENREVVLQLLYYSLENSDASTDLAKRDCISEHTEYGSCFARILNNRMRLGRPHEHLALPEARSYDVCIALQLEALGLGIQNLPAQLALQTAGEREKRLNMNSNKQVIELSKAQRAMAELEWYKRRCKHEGMGYYDSFKLQKDKKDFRANINRGRLATFWDEIIQMVENNELPEDFQYRTKWIYSATVYRQLVEPLDIANHYRLDKHKVSGHYLSAGRPRRYQILQKWLEENMPSEKQERKPRTEPASLTQDSCFWAHLEEVHHSNENHPQEWMPKLKEFENLMKRLIDAQEVSPEIFLANSSFMIWWKNTLPEEYKLTSPLFSLMEGGWKLYSKLH
ncbi:hypothetical protein KI387_000703 [Taxus chinensis]|uniref:Lipase n=1 Tax=Taxus chinensis TaxID=29808 RepID=A0AA38LN91_TAXCH|nr:hypothetical protein KI387_000703 [Taxus chinensis]